MKTNSNVITTIYSIALLVIIFQAESVQAEDYHAVLQITNPKTELTQLVFQECDSKTFCGQLNQDYWRGLKTSCPDCVKEIDTFVPTIPDPYKGVYKNKPITFPYVSYKHIRIIVFGVPMGNAIEVCKQMVDRFEKSNSQAKAILPLNYQ